MARTREQHEAEIRQQTPEIVVTDGAQREVFRSGDPHYGAEVARWADEHHAAEQAIERDEAERLSLRAMLPQWERGAPEQRALAYLLRRAGVSA